jgi:hypothetical protein
LQRIDILLNLKKFEFFGDFEGGAVRRDSERNGATRRAGTGVDTDGFVSIQKFCSFVVACLACRPGNRATFGKTCGGPGSFSETRHINWALFGLGAYFPSCS